MITTIVFNNISNDFHLKTYYMLTHLSRFCFLTFLQIQNGIATYATWTTIASLINLDIVLTTEANMSQMNAAIVSLSVLTVVLFVW